MTRYAFFGDIHGQYAKLQALLAILQAESADWFYVFVGDLIDNKRGITESQLNTLETVKSPSAAASPSGRRQCSGRAVC